jgi:hypothetical protein
MQCRRAAAPRLARALAALVASLALASDGRAESLKTTDIQVDVPPGFAAAEESTNELVAMQMQMKAIGTRGISGIRAWTYFRAGADDNDLFLVLQLSGENRPVENDEFREGLLEGFSQGEKPDGMRVVSSRVRSVGRGTPAFEIVAAGKMEGREVVLRSVVVPRRLLTFNVQLVVAKKAAADIDRLWEAALATLTVDGGGEPVEPSSLPSKLLWFGLPAVVLACAIFVVVGRKRRERERLEIEERRRRREERAEGRMTGPRR